MRRSVSASAVTEKTYCRDRSSPNNEVKPFSHIRDQRWIEETFRRDWKLAFSYASRSSESILRALQWLRRFLAHFEEVNMDVEWIVAEMIDWLKVCDRTVVIQESSRKSNYCEESNSWSSTTRWGDYMDGRRIHRCRKISSKAEEGLGDVTICGMSNRCVLEAAFCSPP